MEAGLARKAPDDVTRFEAEFDLAFHRRVRDGFLAMAETEPERFTVVDAGQSADEVAAAMVRAVDERLARSEPRTAATRIER